jgi:hypothetical protein
MAGVAAQGDAPPAIPPDEVAHPPAFREADSPSLCCTTWMTGIPKVRKRSSTCRVAPEAP